MNLIQNLVNESEKPVYQKSWKELFYDPAKVRSLKTVIDNVTAAEVLKAGLDWDGEGWKTETEWRFAKGQTVLTQEELQGVDGFSPNAAHQDKLLGDSK